jgi:hypothetical protein
MHEIGINRGPFRMLRQRLQQVSAQANEKLCSSGSGVQSPEEFLAAGFGRLMDGRGAQRGWSILIRIYRALKFRRVVCVVIGERIKQGAASCIVQPAVRGYGFGGDPRRRYFTALG